MQIKQKTEVLLFAGMAKSNTSVFLFPNVKSMTYIGKKRLFWLFVDENSFRVITFKELFCREVSCLDNILYDESVDIICNNGCAGFCLGCAKKEIGNHDILCM